MSFNRGGGLRHLLSLTCNAGLHSFRQQSKRSHCFTRPSDSSPRDPADKGEAHKVELGQLPRQQLSGDCPHH